MQLVLVCVRHGEANHNVDDKADMTQTVTVPYTNDGVLDTPLTPRGRSQVTLVSWMMTTSWPNINTNTSGGGQTCGSEVSFGDQF